MNKTTRRIKYIGSLLISILVLAVYSGSAQQIIYVNSASRGTATGDSWNSAYRNLPEALHQAAQITEADPNRVLQVWVASGIIEPADTATTSAFRMHRNVNVYGGFSGNETSIDQRDLINHATYLSGNGKRVLYGDIALTDSAIWDGFTICNAFTNGNGSGAVLKGNALLRNCIFTNNSGNNVVYIDHSGYTVSQSITNLSYCTITTDSCVAVKATNHTTISHCTISIINADYAVSVEGGNTFLNYCTVKNNIGSGVFLKEATLYCSFILYNRKHGVVCRDGNIFGCVISNNGGYGIVDSSTTGVKLINNTIVNNGGSLNAGGIKIVGTGETELYNNVLWGNKNADGLNELETSGGGTLTMYNNAICGGYAGGNETITLETENRGVDNNKHYPFFISPTVGTGPDFEGGNWECEVLSSLINTGTNTLPAGIEIPILDIIGKQTIWDRDNGGIIDRGAFEYQRNINTSLVGNIVYVKEGGSGIKDGTSWENAIENLDEAVAIAHKTGAHSVWVAAGTYYGDGVKTNPAFTMFRAVNVYGGFVGDEQSDFDISLRNCKANKTILDGQKVQRVLYQIANFDSLTIWDGFTLQNGYTYYAGNLNMTPDYAHGAGAYLRAKGMLSNCKIIDNYAAVLSGGGFVSVGGGIYTENSATIQRCEIANNISENRTGGIYLNANSKMNNCLINNNQTPGQYGVALHLDAGTVVENTTIVNNKNTESGAVVGSAVFIANSTAKMKNCIIWGNYTAEQISDYDVSQDADVSFSAIEGGYIGSGDNLTLTSENDGDNAEYYYPRFKQAIFTQGNVSHTSEDHNVANWSLKSTSSCIDQGSQDNLYNNVIYDLDGNPRYVGILDIGAYETSPISLIQGGIIYVAAEGTGDGSSWEKATGDLNYAIKSASQYNRALNNQEKVAVWVKHGTYYGDGVPCNPAFRIEPMVDVYGDLFGNEPPDYDLNLRNFVDGHRSVLDGQKKQRVLLQNGYVASEDGKSFYGFNASESATWDGFTLQRGYTRCDSETPNNDLAHAPGKAKITEYRNRGAGVFLQRNGFLDNCRIIDNETTMEVPDSNYSLKVKLYEGWGAGVFLAGSSILYNCIINGNSSASRCGGVYLDNNSTLMNCVITNNESYGIGSCDGDENTYTSNTERGGAGVYAYHSYIYNATIANNKLKQYQDKPIPQGAGVFLNGTNDMSYLVNSIVWGNVTADAAGNEHYSQFRIHQNAASLFTIKNNAIQQVITVNAPARISNNIVLDSLNDGNETAKKYPKFIYPNNIKGVSTIGGELYSISNWSLRVNSDCINKGNDSLYWRPESYPTDVTNNPRISQDTIDIGAYEYTILVDTSSYDNSVIYVSQTGSGDGSSWLNAIGDLQTAIDSAYSRNAGNDEPFNLWISAGEYYGDLVPGNNGLTLREGVNLYGGFTGTETSIEERDPINNKTILNGRNQQRVVYQEHDFDSLTVLSGFYITGGNSHGENGAGVFLRGNGKLDQCVIENNDAGEGLGGGVYATDGAIINVSSISNNTAANGSAAYLMDSVCLTGCTMTGNTATNPDGYTVVVSNGVSIDTCNVFNNTGGGIYAMNGSQIFLNRITGNTGRGVYADTNVRLINLLIASNNKGGVKALNHSKIYNNTIVNNFMPDNELDAAGMDIDSCEVINTIVWRNKKGENFDQVAITGLSTLHNNAVQDTLLVAASPIIGTATNNLRLSPNNFGSTTPSLSYPFFINPINAVGSDATDKDMANWALLPGSGCFNTGNSILYNAYQLPDIDLLGQPRTAFGVVDIGAYETQWNNSYVYGIVYVKEGGCGNKTGVSWDNAMPSIQGAVAVAEVIDADVWVAKGDYYGESENQNAFIVGDSVNIYGALNGDEPITFDLDKRDFYNDLSVLHGNNRMRVLYQDSESKGHSKWSGFLLSDGYAAADNLNGNGGGAFIRHDVILDHVYVIDCKAEGNGGGIYSEGVNHFCNGGVRDCEAKGNGGAIYSDSMFVVNCLIINNTVTNASSKGAGLYLENYSVVVNNTITYNYTSGGEGGGIYAEDNHHDIYVINNIIWQNRQHDSYNQCAFPSQESAAHFHYNAIQDMPAFMSANHNIKLSPDNIGSDTSCNYPFFIYPSSDKNLENWNILASSSCINAGINNGLKVPYTETDSVTLNQYDLYGTQRLVSDIVDIGAFETFYDNTDYTVVYVVAGMGLGNKTGHSWNDAMGNLTTAAALASVITINNIPTNDHPPVWVAEGTYYGDTTHSDYSFTMFDDAQVYGGFKGNEVPDLSLPGFYDFTQLQKGTSILDGGNTSRVLYQPVDFDSVTAWHGFLIQNGNYDKGAGVYLRKNGAIDYCYVINNHSTGNGGGVYADTGAIVRYSVITYNEATGDGGGMYADHALISQTRIELNTNSGDGGGLYADSSLLINSAILDNNNGGLYAVNKTKLINNTIAGNKIAGNAGTIVTGSGVICDSSVTILNSLIWGNSRGTGDDRYENQITLNSAHVEYSAVMMDTVRGGHNGNISLTLNNSNDYWFPDDLFYPEFINPDQNRRPTINSAFINIAHPQTDSIVASLSLPHYINFNEDLDGKQRVIADIVDMGATELQSKVYTFTCFDTICFTTEPYEVYCHDRNITIYPDMLTGGLFGAELELDTKFTNESFDSMGVYYNYNIYTSTIEVPDVPIVPDVHVCNYDELNDSLGSYVQIEPTATLYWAVNQDTLFSTTPPNRPDTATTYWLYASYNNYESCTSQHSSFVINDSLMLEIYPDTINICYGDTFALLYTYQPDAYWKSDDSTIAYTDTIIPFDTLINVISSNVGTTKIHYYKSTCGHDSVVVVVNPLPVISAVVPSEDTIVSINNLTRYQTSSLGAVSWTVDNPQKADIDPDGTLRPNDTGSVYIITTTVGYGCSSTRKIQIIPCNCNLTIGSLADIRNFRDAVNSGGVYQDQSGANGFAGCTIVQKSKIAVNLSDVNTPNDNWTPIGTASHPFKGFYTGASSSSSYNALMMIRINAPNENGNYVTNQYLDNITYKDTVGVFGYAVGATFDNIRLTGDAFNLSRPDYKFSFIYGNNVVGGIVGYARYSTFTKCASGPQVIGQRNVGGLVGLAEHCIFNECLNIATVEAKVVNAGGIAGSSTEGVMQHIANAGWVKGPQQNGNLGGIVGETNDTIRYCLVTNTVGMPPHHNVSNMGAVIGNALPGATIINTVFDQQMCPLPIQSNTEATVNASFGRKTTQMTGQSLRNVFGVAYWDYAVTGVQLYPRLKHFVTYSLTPAKVQSSTIILEDDETVDAVTQYSCYLLDPSAAGAYLINKYSIECKDTLFVLQFTRATNTPPKIGQYCGVKETPLFAKVTANIEITAEADGELTRYGDTARVCNGTNITLSSGPTNTIQYLWSYKAPAHLPDNTPFYSTNINLSSISTGNDGFHGTSEGWYYVQTITDSCITMDSIYLKEAFCEDTLKMCVQSTMTINYADNPHLWTTSDSTIATLEGNVIKSFNAGIVMLYHAKGTPEVDSVPLLVLPNPALMVSDTTVYLRDLTHFEVNPPTPGYWIVSDSNLAFIHANGDFAPHDTGNVKICFISDYGCSSDTINVHVVPSNSSCAFTIDVSEADSLRAFSEAVNSGGVVYDVNGEQHSAANGFAECNITFSINSNFSPISHWMPIGTASHPFKGKLNGNDITISGLRMSPADEVEYGGLFGVIVNATIYNINVQNLDFQAAIYGTRYAGGLVGYARNSYLYNCTASPYVVSSEYAGGLVGYAENSRIENMINIATVSVTDASGYAGGIVGNANNTIVKNCFNAGWVRRENDNARLGGICGKTNDSIFNCLNVGVIGTPPRENVTGLGNICGDASGEATLSRCAFDTLMNPFATTLGSGNAATDSIYPLRTEQMLSESLKFLFKTASWTYRPDSLYPYPIHTSELTNNLMLAVSPLFILQEGENTDSICAARGSRIFAEQQIRWDNDDPTKPCSNVEAMRVLAVKIGQYTRKEIPVNIHANAAVITASNSSGPISIPSNRTIRIDELSSITLSAAPDHQTRYHWDFEATQSADNAFFTGLDSTTKDISTNNFFLQNVGWYVLNTIMPNCVSRDSVFIEVERNQFAMRLCTGAVDSITGFTPIDGAEWVSENANIATVTPLGRVDAVSPGTVFMNYLSEGNSVKTAVVVVTGVPRIAENDTTVLINTAPYFHIIPSFLGTWAVDNTYLTDIDTLLGRLYPNDTGTVQLYFITESGCSTEPISVTIAPCDCKFPLTHRTDAIVAFRNAVNSGGLFDNSISGDKTPTGEPVYYSAENGFAGCVIYFANLYKINNYGELSMVPSNNSYGNNSDLPARDQGSWKPIGNTAHPFKGTFDGCNRMIGRVYTTDSEQDTVGFFGFIKNATIINFPLGGRNEATIKGNNYVGGMVGYAKNSRIINCSGGPKVQGNNDVGGIVGFADSTLIINTTNTGTVTVLSNNGSGGGIAGSITKAPIKDCLNAGWVKDADNVSAHLGGIVGTTDHQVLNCVNVGAIATRPHPHYEMVGALCGFSNNAIFDSCFYDYQFYPNGRFVGSGDYTLTHSDSMPTAQMLDTNLQMRLSPDNNTWVFKKGMYPSLAATITGNPKNSVIGFVGSSPLVLTDTLDNIDFAGQYSVGYYDSVYVIWSNIDTNVLCRAEDQEIVVQTTHKESSYTVYKEIPLYLYQSLAEITAEVGYVIAHRQDTLNVYENDTITLHATPAGAVYQWSFRGDSDSSPFYVNSDLDTDAVHSIGCGLEVENTGWYYVDVNYKNCVSRDSIFLQVSPTEDTLRLCLGESFPIFSFMHNATWKVQNSEVADVTEGVVIANGVGSAYISFELANDCAKDSIFIIVCDYPSIVEQDTAVFIRNISYFHREGDVMGSWVSGNDAIATIDAQTGRFAPNDTGKVALYLVSDCGGCTDSILVTIYDTCNCAFNLPHRTAAINDFRNAVNSGGFFDNNYAFDQGGDSLRHSAENGFAGCTITFAPSLTVEGNNSAANEWIPIGTTEHPFKGKFNGNNKTITRFRNNTGTLDTAGFFGYVEGAEIYDFVLGNGANAQDTLGGYSGGRCVGGLIGCAKNSYIHNCISAPFATGTENVGGIVGYAENCRLEYITNLGTVTVKGENGNGGGIVGNSVNTVIKDCHNTGWVKSTNATAYIGGIVGKTNSAIITCLNIGVVGTPPHLSISNMGGVCGYAPHSATFDTCIYDRQLSPLPLVGSGNPQIVYSNGLSSQEIISGTLMPLLHNWSFGSNVSPYCYRRDHRAIYSAIAYPQILQSDENVDSVSSYRLLVDNSNASSWINFKTSTSVNGCTDKDSLFILKNFLTFSSSMCYSKLVPMYVAPNMAIISYVADSVVATGTSLVEIAEGSRFTLSAFPDTALSYTWNFRDGGISLPFYTFENQHDKTVSTGEAPFAVTNSGWYILDCEGFNCESRDSINVRLEALDWLFNYDVSWFTQDQAYNPDTNTYNHIYAGYGNHQAGSSKEYPYLISDVYDLRGLAKIVNGGAHITDSLCRWVESVGSTQIVAEDLAPFAASILPSDSAHPISDYSFFNFKGKYIKMSKNIVINEGTFAHDASGDLIHNGIHYDHYQNHFTTQIKIWDPIGYLLHRVSPQVDRSFAGHFNGNNDTISGLYIYFDALHPPTHAYQSLFGYVTDTIENLVLSNSYVGCSSLSAGWLDAGDIPGGVSSFVCYVENGSLINCHTDTSVTISAVGGGRFGGLVTNFDNSDDEKALIKNCSNRASLYGLVATDTTKTYIGGLIGTCYGSLINCKNYGDINITRFAGNSQDICVGGLVGGLFASQTQSVIDSSDNSGSLIVGKNGPEMSKRDFYVGGMAGTIEGGVLLNCFNTGIVDGTIPNVGGFAGVMRDKRVGETNCIAEIKNVKIKNVRFMIEGAYYEGGANPFGGLVGLMYGNSKISNVEVENIKIYFDIISDSLPLATSIGSLVGAMYDNAIISRVNVVNDSIFAKAEVNTSSMIFNVGGIVGRVMSNDAIVENCFLTGYMSVATDSLNGSTDSLECYVGRYTALNMGTMRNVSTRLNFEYFGPYKRTILSIGGMTCINRGKVLNSHVHGHAEVVGRYKVNMMGGFAALNDSTGLVENCYNASYMVNNPENVLSNFGGALVGLNQGRIKNAYNYIYNFLGSLVPQVSSASTGVLQYTAVMVNPDTVLIPFDTLVPLLYGNNLLSALNCWVVDNTTQENGGTYYGWRAPNMTTIDSLFDGYPCYGDVPAYSVAGSIGYDQYLFFDSIPYRIADISHDNTYLSGGTYQWQDSTRTTTWQNITSANDSIYVATQRINDTTWYRRAYIGNCNPSYSNVVKVLFYQIVVPDSGLSLNGDIRPYNGDSIFITSFGAINSLPSIDQYGNRYTYPPFVVTNTIDSVTANSVKVFGTVANGGSSAVIERGFEISTSADFTDGVTSSGDIAGEGETYQYRFTNLTPDTTYYLRAFATNSDGTNYGDVFQLRIEN